MKILVVTETGAVVQMYLFSPISTQIFDIGIVVLRIIKLQILISETVGEVITKKSGNLYVPSWVVPQTFQQKAESPTSYCGIA